MRGTYMKTTTAAALALSLCGPVAAQVITIDNEVVTDYEIVEVRLKTPNGPPVEPPIEPPVDPCGKPPAGSKRLADMNWSKNQGKTFINLQSGKISYSKFKTTGNAGYLGQIGFASVGGGSRYYKRMWISECPGREVLPNDRRCERKGGENGTISWGQNPDARGRCHLKTNTRYYWNIQAVTCYDGHYQCNVNRAGSSNGEP